VKRTFVFGGAIYVFDTRLAWNRFKVMRPNEGAVNAVNRLE
jgi:hypothetical protein